MDTKGEWTIFTFSTHFLYLLSGHKVEIFFIIDSKSNLEYISAYTEYAHLN